MAWTIKHYGSKPKVGSVYPIAGEDYTVIAVEALRGRDISGREIYNITVEPLFRKTDKNRGVTKNG